MFRRISHTLVLATMVVGWASACATPVVSVPSSQSTSPDGKPIPTTGIQVEVATVDSAGKILSTFPARALGEQ